MRLASFYRVVKLPPGGPLFIEGQNPGSGSAPGSFCRLRARVNASKKSPMRAPVNASENSPGLNPPTRGEVAGISEGSATDQRPGIFVRLHAYTRARPVPVTELPPRVEAWPKPPRGRRTEFFHAWNNYHAR